MSDDDTLQRGEVEPLPAGLAETLQRHDETLPPDWDDSATLGPRVTAPAPPELPTLRLAGQSEAIPEYRLGEPLGRGASAVVYQAEHVPLGRMVAVKTIRPDRQGPAAQSALIDEARIACLEHPNIVPVHAVGLDAEGHPLLVMRRIAGEPWRAVMGQPDHPLWRRWPGDALERTLQVTLRVADALSAAHEAGVLHRDVKPGNVVLGPRGEVYLVDWGIAARLDGRGQLIAPLAGTPAYMAPEMFDESRPLDRRSDVYLLGASLYAGLAGQPPRRGRSLTALAVAASSPPPALPGVPAELVTLVQRAMDPDPDARFADIEAFRAALVAFLDHRTALSWVTRGDARREALESLDADAPERNASLAEARFAYRAAIDAWPECATARDGLEALLEETIRVDLARGDVSAARRAFAELPRIRPDLRAAIDDAEARMAAARVELEAARARAEGLDRRGGAGNRRRWLPVMIILVILGPIRAGLWRLTGVVGPDTVHLARGIAPLIVVAGVEIYLRRRVASGTGALFNRQLVRFFQVMVAGSAVSWLRAALGHTTAIDAAFDSLVLQFTVGAMAALVVDRRFGAVVLSGVIGAAVALAVPLAGELALGIHLFVTVLMLERLWQRGGAVSGAPGPSSAA